MQESAAKFAIGFFSSIKIFENTAFDHVNEMPNSRECDSNSLWSSSYSKEWVCNLRTKCMLHYFREGKSQLCETP